MQQLTNKSAPSMPCQFLADCTNDRAYVTGLCLLSVCNKCIVSNGTSHWKTVWTSKQSCPTAIPSYQFGSPKAPNFPQTGALSAPPNTCTANCFS